MRWAIFLSQNVYVYLQTLLRNAPRKLPSSVKKRTITAISPFKVIQGRRFWYQLKAHIRLPISDQYQLTSYLAPFRRYSIPNVKNRYTWLALLRLNPPTEGFPRTICVKFSANVNRWSRYQMANEFSVVNIAFL